MPSIRIRGGAQGLSHAGRVRRCAAVLAALGGFWLAGAPVSGGRVLGLDRGGVVHGLMVTGTGTVSFSALVKPNGRATTAYFEFGLGTRYREPRPPGVVYDESTPAVHLGAGFRPHLVWGRAAGLVPNAIYNLRLVAASSAGTVDSPNTTFRTAKDRAPSPPRIGATANVEPVSGLALIQPPSGHSPMASAAQSVAAGAGFLPLTEARQMPIASQVDARAGALQMVLASPRSRHPQQVTLSGALFSLSQSRGGSDMGLTTFALLENDFPGAPTDNRCAASISAAALDAHAPVARSSGLVLQTLRARDDGGRFRTLGRYGAATGSAGGTVWDTIDRCDGTLIIVQRGTVLVSDLGLGTTLTVHAGQRYLAQAPRQSS
jgi:hypothetical protein